MKSDKVPLPAKVGPKPVPSTAEIDSSVENKEAARVGSREKSTKFVYGEVAKICALLKPDLLEDMDKMIILVVEFIHLDQEDAKATKEVARPVTTETYSSAKKVKKLEFELAALKGSNIFAPTSLQLEIVD
ncbi:hypothetical protein ACFX10_038132 [Malus domestica]